MAERGNVGSRVRRPLRVSLLIAAAACAVLCCLALASLAIGSKPLTLSETWRGLTHADGSRAAIIVWQLRMPRTALAVIVGAALAVAGVLMQALTRNRLAEPGLLGVNSGAAFAVVLSITLLGVTSPLGYIGFAFAGSAAAAVFVYVIDARFGRESGGTRLVLAGAALSACLGACTGIITMRDTDAFSSYRFWVIGSVADRSSEVLAATAPFALAGLVLAALCGPALNALVLGDEQAAALGVSLPLARTGVFASITLLCGAATAAAGPIGFVGLIVPQLLAILAGAEQRTLLALSVLMGPSLMLAADITGRVIAVPDELEAGIVTAFIGAPVLIGLLLSGRRI